MDGLGKIRCESSPPCPPSRWRIMASRGLKGKGEEPMGWGERFHVNCDHEAIEREMLIFFTVRMGKEGKLSPTLGDCATTKTL